MAKIRIGRLDPYLGCNFMVVTPNFIVGGFQKVSGLEGSVEVKNYAEGGRNSYEQQFTGASRWPNLVLSRGLIDSDAMYGWFSDVTQGIRIRFPIIIMCFDLDGSVVTWWDVVGALPVKWSGPSFDATSDTIAMESLEFSHHGIIKDPLARAMSATRLAADLAAEIKAAERIAKGLADQATALAAKAKNAISSGISTGVSAVSSGISTGVSTVKNATGL